ncbi:MAG: polysaccharide export protein [Acidobacteriota bacterium]|jgi:polysaccharide export outer membrane protein|nr:polysaccharide export protein [Acidobacteriota bacterium]
MRKWLCCIILLGLSTGLSAQDAQVADDYVIGEEDILSINVWREPELSMKELSVRADGKISLPLVDEIQASGKTTGQLKEEITERLQEFVESPTVSVVVVKVLSHHVSVVGKISKPGLYVLTSPTTVMELIARAGGLAADANGKNIQIIRKEIGTGRELRFPFNYKNVIKGKELHTNILLEVGDMVLVP